MLDRESSLRLRLLSFPLIVGVVFVHGYETNVSLSDGVVRLGQTNFLSDFVRNLISQGFARTAVPLFFLVSGYLFFFGFQWSTKNYAAKIKTRARTLLVPFLFWNIATVLALALAQAISITEGYFSGQNLPIANFDARDYLDAIFGIGRMPIAYQFWFIRDLMLVVLLAPAIYVLNRSTTPLLIGIVSVFWFLGIWPVFAPSADAVLFFSVGTYLALNEKSIFVFDPYGRAAIMAYVPIVVTDALLAQESYSPYLHKFGIVVGVFAMLFATQLIAASKRLKAAILSVGSASFFVYAAHEPLLTITRKLMYETLVPESPSFVLALYFTIPIVVISSLVLVYKVASHIAPNALAATTGGR